MKSLNKFMGIGNIGKEPELRFMTNGQPVLNFSIAMSVKVTDQNSGEAKELTEWVDVTLFGKLAETMHQFLSTGKAVFVEGHLHTRSWEKSINETDTITMYRTGVIAQNIILLTPKNQAMYSGEGDPDDANDPDETIVPNVEAAARMIKPEPATVKAAPVKAAPAKAAPAKAAPAKAAPAKAAPQRIPF
jgi:single-strand DNA-binding protein